MKVILLAGTINHFSDTEEVRYVHVDAADRPIYNSELNMMLAPDVVADLSENLPMFDDGVFDEIRCHHVLEHMNYDQGRKTMTAFRRVLKPNGILDVETPDMSRIAKSWLDGTYQQADLQQWIHGEDLKGPFDGHRYSYSADSLKKLVTDGGFKIIENPATGLAVRYIAKRR